VVVVYSATTDDATASAAEIARARNRRGAGAPAATAVWVEHRREAKVTEVQAAKEVTEVKQDGRWERTLTSNRRRKRRKGGSCAVEGLSEELNARGLGRVE
jgi:predicted acetyltransferase